MQIFLLVLVILLNTGCNKNEDNSPPISGSEVTENPTTPVFTNEYVETDKAVYSPGDVVTFLFPNASLPASLKVRYKYLNAVLQEENITATSWTWKAPDTDFRGYIAEIYSTKNEKETIYATIGIDVSSSWTKFPRYGFLSDYKQYSDEEINSVIGSLSRYHINGLQFYDWHNKHHQPLSVSESTPASSWKDIANRDIYFSTVQKYIENAHNHNMKTMFYNLVYGAWENAEGDGVKKEWYAYKDAGHLNKEVMTLPSPPFLSNLFLLDPSNTEWQKYIQNENKKVYEYLDFDGYHMDQLGDWGAHYKYDGTPLTLGQTFKSFIESVKEDEPGKYIVMNAVNQYGQQGIAAAPSDFLYTEVWAPNDSYSDLAYIIQQNSAYSNGTKNTILAAYMNYDIAEQKGFFNTGGVLMTDAVIFAFGGAHLELGEHMLGKEYFPNNNLVMKADLKIVLNCYYDFWVAYQNLLRDGGTFNQISVLSTDNKIAVRNWPANLGSVAAVCKKVGASQVIHLINFTDAKNMNWRDNDGTQSTPALKKDLKLTFSSNEVVKKVWTASPDVIGGASRCLNFVQNGNEVKVVLPELKYWSMIVFEYE